MKAFSLFTILHTNLDMAVLHFLFRDGELYVNISAHVLPGKREI